MSKRSKQSNKRTVELVPALSKPKYTLELTSPPCVRSTATEEIRLRLAEMTLVTEPGTHVRFLAGVINGLSGSEGSLSIKYVEYIRNVSSDTSYVVAVRGQEVIPI